jgi:hypothetical protein
MGRPHLPAAPQTRKQRPTPKSADGASLFSQSCNCNPYMPQRAKPQVLCRQASRFFPHTAQRKTGRLPYAYGIVSATDRKKSLSLQLHYYTNCISRGIFCQGSPKGAKDSPRLSPLAAWRGEATAPCCRKAPVRSRCWPPLPEFARHLPV